jgi:hypothetical protein
MQSLRNFSEALRPVGLRATSLLCAGMLAILWSSAAAAAGRVAVGLTSGDSFIGPSSTAHVRDNLLAWLKL